MLVIDDQPPNLWLIERILQKAGSMQVLTTTDSHIGLELQESHGPYLLLLDLMMPMTDGFQVPKDVKCRTAPVIREDCWLKASRWRAGSSRSPMSTTR